MKIAAILSLLLLSACSSLDFETNIKNEIRLNKISAPKTNSHKKLATVKAQLVKGSGTVIERDSGSLGSCSECVRGFGVSDYLGIQIVGTNAKKLKALRKQSKDVKIVDCPQGKNFESEYSCTFKVKGQTYSLKLLLKS